MLKTAGYHNLLIWQRGKEFIKRLYAVTENFPRSEIHGLQSQTRRAAVSLLLNLVEGQRRSSRKEFLRFLDIADASLVEVEACLEIALYLSYLKEDEYDKLENKRRELAIMLRSFIKSVYQTRT
jgi:four helix bundle protein